MSRVLFLFLTLVTFHNANAFTWFSLATADKDKHLQQATELAKSYLDKAISNPQLRNLNEEYYNDLVLLKSAFNNGFQFELDSCDSDEKKNLIAYTHSSAMDPQQDWYFFRKGEKKVNKVYICKAALVRSREVLAQNIIHEVSHLSLQTGEQKATGLEIIAVLFGGGSPFLNGYTYYGRTWRYQGVQSWLKMSEDEMLALGTSWLKIPGFIDNSFSYEMNQLQSDVIFGHAKKEILEILTEYQGHEDQVLKFRNNEGMTLLMLAAREGHLEIFKSVLERGGIALLFDKNNLGQDCKAIALENRRDQIIEYIQTVK
ncbi:MAG: ankyrin repeat domain-containing protein [Bdellovibrionaceae bacterium]|nr:ankyrin repeat domain-containing protein [Pseudobdellovibrionaceae bacterium]